MITYRLILLMLLGAFSKSAMASPNALEPNLTFERISLEDGLSQSTIKNICQDQTGFLWLATDDGLNRYDGYGFKVYKNQPFTTTTLPSSRVDNIFPQSDGTLWVATLSGVATLNRDNETFTRYPRDEADPAELGLEGIVKFKEDKQGRVWIWGNANGGYLVRFDPSGSFKRCFSETQGRVLVTGVGTDRNGTVWVTTKGQGLFSYDESSDRFNSYRHDSERPDSISSDFINFGAGDLVFDDFGQLWFPTALGLDCFNLETKTVKHYPFPQHSSPFANPVFRWFQDSNGYFWVQRQSGLYQFDPANHSYHSYQHDPDNPYSAPKQITSWLESKSGTLWFTTQNQGICRFDRSSKAFIYSRNDPHNPKSLGSNFLTTLFEDRSGTLWFGGTDSGLSKHSPQKEKFRHYLHPYRQPKPITDNMVWSLLVDQSGFTWVGTWRDGLLKLNKDRTEILAQYESGTQVLGLFQDREGAIWFLGVSRLGNFTKSIDPLTGVAALRTEMPFFHAASLPDRQGFIFAAGQLGIGQYSYEDRACRRLPIQGAMPWISALKVLVLQDGRYLVANTDNVILYQPKDHTYETLAYDPKNPKGIGPNQILSIYQTKDGLVWLGHYGGGLDRLDLKTKTVKNYTMSDGMANDVVYEILSDSQGDLWLSTNGGLIRFKTASETFRNFDTFDGLQSLEFNNGPATQAPDGELLFGGVNGFNAFYPREIKVNSQAPDLTLSAWLKMNQLIESNLESNKALELEPNEPMITFTYAGLDYVEPSKNSYAYQLEGFDKEWQFVNKVRWATYTNLPSGEYFFRVKAANSDGIWTEKPLSVLVRVRPHYYETVLFRVGVLLLVFALANYAYYRQRQNSRRRQEEALMLRDHLRKSEELEFARSLQLAMLPRKDLEVGSIEILGEMITATEVGGDYFDFFELGDQRVAIAYGDATGHGVAAGLIVGMVKLASTVWSLNPKPLQAMVSDLNQGLRRTLPLKTMGMGFGLAMYHLDTHEVEICSSGMPYPYHFKAATGQLVPLVMKGPPLGYLKQIDPPSISIHLAQGDRVIFLSDGFDERFNTEKQMWGGDAVAQCLRSACQRLAHPSEIAAELIANCNQFAGERECDDDMTIVVLQRQPQPVAETKAALLIPQHSV